MGLHQPTVGLLYMLLHDTILLYMLLYIYVTVCICMLLNMYIIWSLMSQPVALRMTAGEHDPVGSASSDRRGRVERTDTAWAAGSDQPCKKLDKAHKPIPFEWWVHLLEYQVFGGCQQYQYHIFSGCSAIFLLYTYSSTCALLPSMFLLWFESCGHGPCWFFPLGSAQLFIPPDSPDAICVPNPDVSRMVSQLDEALYSKSTPQTCRECATTMSLAIWGMIFNLWPCFVEILWLTSGCMFQN